MGTFSWRQVQQYFRKVKLFGLSYANFVVKNLISQSHCALYYKTFYGRNLQMFVIRQTVCQWQALLSFQPRIMFVGKTTILTYSGAHESASLGQALAFLTNIRLGWKGLPGANTLAHYKYLFITTVKSFITSSPGLGCKDQSISVAFVIKLFTTVINSVEKKASVFVTVNYSHPSLTGFPRME